MQLLVDALIGDGGGPGSPSREKEVLSVCPVRVDMNRKNFPDLPAIVPEGFILRNLVEGPKDRSP
jgi:hypothetical protein